MAQKQPIEKALPVGEENLSFRPIDIRTESVAKIQQTKHSNELVKSINLLEHQLQVCMTTFKDHMRQITECATNIESVQKQLFTEINEFKSIYTDKTGLIPITNDSGDSTQLAIGGPKKYNEITNAAQNSDDQNHESRQIQLKSVAANDDKLKPNAQTSALCKRSSLMATKTTPRQYFPCNVCTRVFKNKVSLRKHVKLHQEKMFHCKVCPNTSFRGQDEFDIHKLSHSSKGLFHCKLCGEYFSRATALYLHIRSHKKANGKRHTCRICTKICLSLTTLRVHEKTHFSTADNSF